MCLTFFIRTFLAGNSAACEVNVSTLGPPSPDWDYVRNRLRVYDREQGTDKADGRPPSPSPSRVTSLAVRLRIARFFLENRTWCSRTLPHGRRPEAQSVRQGGDRPRAQTGLERMVEKSGIWPGIHTGMTNWRELYSLTFTNDFFGNTESQAVLKTLYDRICRSALDQLKELGSTRRLPGRIREIFHQRRIHRAPCRRGACLHGKEGEEGGGRP